MLFLNQIRWGQYAPEYPGKGVIWHFLCPATRKRCRKLYLVDTYFLHREAFNGCFYEK